MEQSYTFKNIPREKVWEVIQNKNALKKALPGCKKFEEVEDDVYDATLGINIGPIKGEFTANVQQVEMDEPAFYRLLVKAKGKPGEIDANAAMSLEDSEEGTILTCSADIEVTGLLASVGQRVMGGVAKVVLGQFFKDIEKQIE